MITMVHLLSAYSKKYNLSGYFRIDFDNYCILLQIKNESDNNISEKELSTIYQDNFPIGNLLSIFVKDENTYLLITTQMPLIFKKGNRLNSLDQKLIFTILDYTILGNSNLLYLQKINDLLDTTNDLKYGIFKLEKFKLNALAHAKSFRIENILPKYNAIYQTLCHTKNNK